MNFLIRKLISFLFFVVSINRNSSIYPKKQYIENKNYHMIIEDILKKNMSNFFFLIKKHNGRKLEIYRENN